MKKTYKVIIYDNDNLGNGITKIDNKICFVEKSLKNEELLIEITKTKKNYSFGKILKIIKPSPYRKEPKCPYYNTCGGCAFGHTDYQNSLKIKEDYLNKLFKTNKKINHLNEYNYRNKVTLHVKNNKIGFYKKETNQLIEIDNCLLLNKKINQIIKELKQINLNKVDEITIRSTKKEALININGTITTKNLLLLTKNKTIKSIYNNYKKIYGKDNIIETINNINYIISPKSFFQINTNMMIELYNEIKRVNKYHTNLLDLYCGVGSIGIFLHNEYKHICGVEILEEAIQDAKKNTEINNIKNIEFICGDASIKKASFETIIVDPPRNGLSKNVLKNIIDMKPKQIIYVSCNPNTLKRDIELLDNYKLEDINFFEMFPWTTHIECVCVMKLC